MNYLVKFWKDFRTQPDIWFFYGFLATFTLTIRKVIAFYPIAGNFNEYTGIYLYLSDIFLLITLVIFAFIILCNKFNILSIYTNVPRLPRGIFHACPADRDTDNTQIVPRGTIYKKMDGSAGVEHFYWGGTLFIPFLLITWSFASIIWSQMYQVALFRSIKLLELYLLYAYIIMRIVPRRTLLRYVFNIVIATGIFQSIIAILQFLFQRSLGLTWLWESHLGSAIPGVAKIAVSGENIIRAYGLFPHPNILGGFLLICIVLTISYRYMFHVEHIYWGGTSSFLNVALAIEILAQMLTLSKSAIMGTIIAITYLYYIIYVPRGTYVKNIMRHKKIWLSVLILIFLAFIVKPDINSFMTQSLNERLIYINVSRGTILHNFITGTGIGQFVPTISKYSSSILESWQYQPVHNVFLLIWSELGIIGLGLFIWLLWKMFHPSRVSNVPRQKECSTFTPLRDFVPHGTKSLQLGWNILRGRRGTFNLNIIFRSILIGFIFIMFFDHYLWDIQQGMIILWIILALV